MPAKKPANTAQELSTSNHTSSLFLGSTQRPWMSAGLSGSASNTVSGVGGLRRANIHNERTTSKHNAVQKSVPGSVSASASKHGLTKTPEGSVRQGIVTNETQNVREEQTSAVPSATNRSMRGEQTTTETEHSESIRNAIPHPIATVTNRTEVFPARPVVSPSIPLVSEVGLRDARPLRFDTSTPQQMPPGSLQTGQGINSLAVASAVLSIPSFQSTADNRGHSNPPCTQSRAELVRTSLSTAVATIPSIDFAHSAVHIVPRTGPHIHGQVQIVTSSQPLSSNTSAFRSVTRSNETGPTMLRPDNVSPAIQGSGQQPAELASSGSAHAFVAIFDQHVDIIRRRHTGPLNSVSEGRITWVRNACHSDDLYFLLLHQIYCIWSLKKEWLWSKIGFGPDQEDGFRCLESLMVSNLALPPELLELFGRFINSYAVLENEPVLKSWIASIREFLKGFPLRWNDLKQICTARGSPPCTWEICQQLNFTKSPVLQRACFNSLRRQLFPGSSAAFAEEITRIFDEDQRRFIERLQNATLNHLPYSENVKIFARYCNFVKDKHGQAAAHIPEAAVPTIPSPTATRPSTGPPLVASVISSDHTQGVSTSMGPRMETNNPDAESSPSQMSHSSTIGPPRPIRPAASTRSNMELNAHHMQTDSGRSTAHTISARLPTSTASTSTLPLNTHRASMSSSLFPPAEFRLFVLVNPDLDTVALHQAHLRSPCIQPQISPEGSTFRRYCYLQGFLLAPQIHTNDRSFSSWSFEFPLSLAAHLVKDVSPASDDVFGQKTRSLDHDSILTSIRCVQLPTKQGSISVSTWSASPTHWPECGFFSLNDEFIEVRRKVHHRRDLPADVTSVVRSGENKLCFSYIFDPNEAGRNFAIALEVIKVSDHQRALDAPTRIDAQTSLEMIRARLKSDSKNDDDDLVMVDAYICIDLIDPFTSRVFEMPVRGASCLHRECFDLESFLQSRPSRNKNGVITPDEWLCPICKRDARPTSLVLDEFLLQVKTQLVEQGRMDVKAILVKEDGSWEPKSETVNAAPGNDVSAEAQESMQIATEGASDQNNKEESSSVIAIQPHGPPPMIIDLMDD